jgi:CheY-like chemotaxis protein
MENKRTLSILSIDDDSSCNLVAAKFFTLIGGHKVDVAENGREGLKKASQLRPDIILLDMRMPDMNGLEVMDALCADAATRDIPVIMLTGASLDYTEEVSLKVKRNFLRLEQKPANFTRLLGEIEAALLPGILRPGAVLGDRPEPA